MEKLTVTDRVRYTRSWHALLLFAVAAYLIYPLLADGYFFGHERLTPLYRVYGIDLAVESGQFPAKVLPNLVNGLGYGWNIFYSPFVYDLTWLISALGFSYITSAKLVHFLALALSGVFIYLLVMRITVKRTAALIAAVLYMTAPYRLADLYIRNAYAESFAFVFLPVVFLGVYEIFHGDPRRWWVLATGMSGIVLTHNISGLYCALFVTAYVAMHARQLGEEIALLRSLGLAVLMSILLTAYFIGPLLEHKAADSYAIFNAGVVSRLHVSADQLRGEAVKPWELFSRPLLLGAGEPGASDQPVPFLLGLPLILFAALGVYSMQRHAAWSFVRFSTAAALLSLVMLLEGFPWELMPGFLYYIQFPWRLLLFTVFFLSLVGGMAVLWVPERYQRTLFIVPVVILLCVDVFGLIKPNYYSSITDASIPAVEDVRRSTANVGTGYAEYLPIQGYEHLAYLRAHDGVPRVLRGAATLAQLSRHGTNMTTSVANHGTEALIELPLVHYLGYKATLQTQDGVMHDLRVSEGPNGLSTVLLQDSGVIAVWYGVTPWSGVAYAMTLTGLIWLALIAGCNIHRAVPFVPQLRRH